MHASTSGKYNNAIREVNALSKCGRLLTQQSQMLSATCLRQVLKRPPHPQPLRGEIINHIPSMKHMFQRFDSILLTKTCSSPRWRIAVLNSGNKTALIGIGIYFQIKSVRHSVAWLSSRHQSDPRWEPFSRSETLIDTLGDAVWHHMLGFKSKNPTPPYSHL